MAGRRHKQFVRSSATSASLSEPLLTSPSSPSAWIGTPQPFLSLKLLSCLVSCHKSVRGTGKWIKKELLEMEEGRRKEEAKHLLQVQLEQNNMHFVWFVEKVSLPYFCTFNCPIFKLRYIFQLNTQVNPFDNSLSIIQIIPIQLSFRKLKALDP